MDIKSKSGSLKIVLIVIACSIVAALGYALYSFNSASDDAIVDTDERVALVNDLTRQGDLDTLISLLHDQLESAQDAGARNEIAMQLVAAYLNNNQDEEAVAFLDQYFSEHSEGVSTGLVRTYAENLDNAERYADAITYYRQFIDMYDSNDVMREQTIEETNQRIAELERLL